MRRRLTPSLVVWFQCSPDALSQVFAALLKLGRISLIHARRCARRRHALLRVGVTEKNARGQPATTRWLQCLRIAHRRSGRAKECPDAILMKSIYRGISFPLVSLWPLAPSYGRGRTRPAFPVGWCHVVRSEILDRLKRRGLTGEGPGASLSLAAAGPCAIGRDPGMDAWQTFAGSGWRPSEFEAMFEWSEWVVIGVVALIVIGPKELPAVLRAIGQWDDQASANGRGVSEPIPGSDARSRDGRPQEAGR
jgi:hypothetical protein